MQLEALKSEFPAYARDLRVNWGNVMRSDHLNEQQLWGTVLAVAIATRSPRIIAAATADAAEHLDKAAMTDAQTAASLMAMNNVYYRFVHLVKKPEYSKLPARLRMQGMAQHSVPKADFELWSLAVSAVNGCGMCLQSHEQVVTKAGMTPEMVQDAVRIAAVFHAAASGLDVVGQSGDSTQSSERPFAPL